MEDRWKIASDKPIYAIHVLVDDAQKLKEAYYSKASRMVDEFTEIVNPILAQIGRLPVGKLSAEVPALEAIMKSAQGLKVLYNYGEGTISFTYLLRVEQSARKLLQKANA